MNTKPIFPEQLQRFCVQSEAQFDEIPTARKRLLTEISASVESEPANSQLIFICTHNSRRSHFAQVWSDLAIRYYGVQSLRTWSGGTEVTECNLRTINALCRAGMTIVEKSDGPNPVYRMGYSPSEPLINCFSKIYNEPPNPNDGFVAALCCADVDESCPVITGARERFPLHYEDPKSSDETADEDAVYDTRCQQISREMFFLVSQLTK